MICNEITRLGCSTPQECLLGNKQQSFWEWEQLPRNDCNIDFLGLKEKI